MTWVMCKFNINNNRVTFEVQAEHLVKLNLKSSLIVTLSGIGKELYVPGPVVLHVVNWVHLWSLLHDIIIQHEKGNKSINATKYSQLFAGGCAAQPYPRNKQPRTLYQSKAFRSRS